MHQNLNPDMTVLMTRKEGDRQEPYTWVRNQGKGRVFYTAYGHNDSTWTNPGFQKLVDNGVLWAIGDKGPAADTRLNIPNVDIYESSGIAISDYTKRHLVPKMQEALKPDESQKADAGTGRFRYSTVCLGTGYYQHPLRWLGRTRAFVDCRIG